MSSNKAWIGLVAVMALITLWFTWGAAEKLYEYARLKRNIGVQIKNWSVEKVAQDRYALKAQYSYMIEGNEYQGETLFDGAVYRNPWAAEEAIPIENVKAWKAWYAGGDYEISSLQKKFPMKETLYTAILWSLLIYFIWLSFYVTRVKHR